MVNKRPKRSPRPGVDEYGRTPLHYAAADSDATLVRTLLKEGAPVFVADDDGWTPLHFAAQSNAVEVAEVLLDAGAPVDALDSNGNTPLWRATFSSQGRGDLVSLLRARGADPGRSNLNGISAKELARSIRNHDVAQFFSDLP